MNFIKDVLRGMVIGVANIIPGVSGGTMAVSMGIYDKMIHAITHIISEIKSSIKTLLPILIGMLLGIGALSFVISAMFEHIPVQTNLLFIGLIIGSLPILFKEFKGVTIRGGHILLGILFFTLVVGMPIVGNMVGDGGQDAITGSLFAYIKLFAVGVVASATMVIPGVSGSMMLTIMGYYEPVINAVKDFIKALAAFDTSAFGHNLLILIPFGIGVLLGIGVIAKVVEILFSKCPIYAYSAIVGLIIGSPIAIFYEYISENGTGKFNFISILTGIVLLAVGCVIALCLSEDKTKKDDVDKEKTEE